MTDLTFLVPPSHVSPMPFPAQKSVFRVGRPVSRSNTDTLESDMDSEAGTPGLSSSSDSSISRSPSTSSLQSPTTLQSPGLLAPPVNTWKSRSRSQTRRSRHRVTRSQSAPPGRISSSIEDRQREVDHPLVSAGTVWPIPRRSVTSFSLGSSTRGGELIRPPPPLCKLYSFSPLYPIRYIFSPFSPFFHFIDNTHTSSPVRPTTFWRKTKRSGVTGASYSPSSHLIRRSTFIAAGLTFDAPIHDLSALCVESRIGFIVVPPDHKLQ